MKKITHSITSMGFSVLLFSFFLDPLSMLLVAGVAFVLGGINDWLDFAIFRIFEHRNWFTHSLLSPILVIGILSVITSAILSLFWVFLISTIFSVAWIVHVLLDSLNPTGVYLFSLRRIILGKIHYKNSQWNLIFIGIGLFAGIIGFSIIYFWFYK